MALERPLFVVRALADAALAVALAPACAACRHPLDSPTRSAVCDRCWQSVAVLRPPFCDTCGDPILASRCGPATTARGDDARDPPGGRARRCAQCPATPGGAIARVRSTGEYDGALRSILHAFKYEGRRSLGAELGALMREHGQDVLAGADAVVPVPLHWGRHWRRGFNQAAELAAALGRPVLPALGRARPTASQADLPADRRHANVRGAFRLRRGVRVAGTCLVLVDDVRTTGATLESCAAVLEQAGAREVRALTAARVVTRRPPARRG